MPRPFKNQAGLTFTCGVYMALRTYCIRVVEAATQKSGLDHDVVGQFDGINGICASGAPDVEVFALRGVVEAGHNAFDSRVALR